MLLNWLIPREFNADFLLMIHSVLTYLRSFTLNRLHYQKIEFTAESFDSGAIHNNNSRNPQALTWWQYTTICNVILACLLMTNQHISNCCEKLKSEELRGNSKKVAVKCWTSIPPTSLRLVAAGMQCTTYQIL